MLTRKQKPIVDTQKIKTKQSEHTTTENHQTIRRKARQKEIGLKTSQKQ